MPLAFEVSCDVPFDLYPGRCEGFEEYITLKEQICYDYRHPPDLRRLYVEGQRSVRENTPARLRYGLRFDDGPLMLDHCLRALAICHPLVHTDVHPLFTAQRLAGVDQPPPMTPEEEARFRLPVIKNITPRLRLQGLACYAHMNFYAGWADGKGAPTAGSILSAHNGMFNACSAANVCVGLGFVPPITIRIAAYMATTEARFGVDLRRAPRYKELHHLWAMHRSYVARLQAKEAARLKRVAKAPHLYRCANDGCEIQATNKSALRRCGGVCAPEHKPRYCSEPCQRQHWVIHREFCKTEATSDYTNVIDDDGDPDWIDVAVVRKVPLKQDHPWEGDWPLFAEREGPEIFVDIRNDSPFRKGDVIRVKTRTLSAECLKAYGSVWGRPKPTWKNNLRSFIEELMTNPPPNMGFPGPEREGDGMAVLQPW